MTTIRTQLIPVVLLTGLLSILVPGNLQSQDLAAAIRYTKSEQFDSADFIFRQLIQAEPNNSKVYFFSGENRILDYFSDTISNSLIVLVNQAKEIFSNGVQADTTDALNYI